MNSKRQEIRNAVILIAGLLSIFIIPIIYTIQDNKMENELEVRGDYTIGSALKATRIKGRYYVSYAYKVNEIIYDSRSVHFDGTRPIPEGLPILIKYLPENPEEHIIAKDSIVPLNDSILVRYYYKFVGGWTYEYIHK